MTLATATVVSLPGDDALQHRIETTGVLLERPGKWTSPPASSVAYLIYGGRVVEKPLASLRLPQSVCGRAVVSPGPNVPETVPTLPALAEIADRICPWVRIAVVPALYSKMAEERGYGLEATHYHLPTGRYASAGGLASYDGRVILAVLSHPTATASTLFHELWHQMWFADVLSYAARDLMEAATKEGPDLPSAYTGNLSERTARLFEHYASARHEGMPAPAMTNYLSVGNIVEAVWNGDNARDAVRNDNLPEGVDRVALADRLGIRLPTARVPAPQPVVNYGHEERAILAIIAVCRKLSNKYLWGHA